MNFYTSQNSRRFFRHDLDLKCHITTHNYQAYSELSSNGIHYVNRPTEIQMQVCKKQIVQNLQQLTQHQDIIQAIVKDFFARTNLIYGLLKHLDQGSNIKKDPQTWQNRTLMLNGSKHINRLQDKAQVTYGLLKHLETKLLFYGKKVLQTCLQSTANTLHLEERDELFNFNSQISKRYAKRLAEGENSYLLNVILLLENLIKISIQPYQNLASDWLLGERNNEWPLQNINTSATGIGIYSERFYPFSEHAQIQLYLPDFDELISFEARLARQHYDETKRLNSIGFDFYFPENKAQQDLISYLHIQEIKKAMELTQDAGK